MSQPSRSLQPVEAAELLLGAAHPLVEQLGSTEGLVELGAAANALTPGGIYGVAGLERFLAAYQSQLLIPVELPAIRRAFEHTLRHETRELIDLDAGMGRLPVLRDFAAASQRVGRAQLRRLRPLRDQRVVQRYLRAVEDGEAFGWHSLVYGLTLAQYSLPLRQGLMNYAQQTLRGFVASATPSLRLTETSAAKLFELATLGLPDAVELTLAVAGLPTGCR